MEAGDSTARQSGPSTANSLDHYNRRPRERIETYHEGGSMATATLVGPGSGYHSHHSSFSSGYPHSAPPTSIPGMISPIEPRRPSDEGESSHGHRQSLPSISEVMGTKSMAFPPPAAQLPQPQTLPSPFAPSGPPRPFDPTGDRNASPRALHPSTTSFPRPETLPAFDHARPSLASRPAPPPLNTFTATHQPPMPTKHEQQHSIDSAHSEAHPLSANHRPPTQSLPSLYQETRQLPPGQLPLSAYPVSPRHTGPTLPSPYESQRSSTYGNEESESAHPRTAETRSAIDRSFESWGYETNLSTVANACRTGYNLAEAYLAAAREHQPSSLIPSRMPTENELSEVINSLMMGLKKLEDIRDMVHTTRLNSERARENGGGKDDEDVNMFGDGMKQPYGMGEVKKRRGRAAPPGRCHSCNRVDTPEWRRGPDGARTLCNACGLHYAKLERKRLTDQRSIRPKPSDDRH